MSMSAIGGISMCMHHASKVIYRASRSSHICKSSIPGRFRVNDAERGYCCYTSVDMLAPSHIQLTILCPPLLSIRSYHISFEEHLFKWEVQLTSLYLKSGDPLAPLNDLQDT